MEGSIVREGEQRGDARASPSYDSERTVGVAPPVIGTEMMGTDDEQVVDELFTPTARPVAGEDATLVLRELQDGSGRHAMLVYQSLEVLIQGCGEEQPWMGFRLAHLHDLQHLAGADVVIWDADLAPEDRQVGEYDEGNETL